MRVPMLATTEREESIWPTLACSCGAIRSRNNVKILLPHDEDVQPAEQGVQLIGGELAFLVELGFQIPQAEVDALDPRAQLLDVHLGVLGSAACRAPRRLAFYPVFSCLRRSLHRSTLPACGTRLPR